jgi:hypothetical protein
VSRALLLNPVLVLATAAGGYELCRALGIDPHARAETLAVIVACLAVVVSSIPLLRQPVNGVAASRAALSATTLHLFTTAVAAVGVLLVTADASVRAPFAFWILALYWATLAGVAVAAVATVRGPVGTDPPAARSL